MVLTNESYDSKLPLIVRYLFSHIFSSDTTFTKTNFLPPYIWHSQFTPIMVCG